MRNAAMSPQPLKKRRGAMDTSSKTSHVKTALTAQTAESCASATEISPVRGRTTGNLSSMLYIEPHVYNQTVPTGVTLPTSQSIEDIAPIEEESKAEALNSPQDQNTPAD